MPSTGVQGSTSSAFPSDTIRPGRPGRENTADSLARTSCSSNPVPKPSSAIIRPLRAVVRDHKAALQTALLIGLNPVIRGWAAYYRTVVSKEVFASCDYHLMSTLKHWMGRRHGHKGARWVFNKYCRRGATGRLEFSTQPVCAWCIMLIHPSSVT